MNQNHQLSRQLASRARATRRHDTGDERERRARWRSLLARAEDPGYPAGPRARIILETGVDRALAEIENALREQPSETELHLLGLRLRRACPVGACSRDHVRRHARCAALSAPADPAVLRLCGDALSADGLEHGNIDEWREGVSLLRRAYHLSRFCPPAYPILLSNPA